MFVETVGPVGIILEDDEGDEDVSGAGGDRVAAVQYAGCVSEDVAAVGADGDAEAVEPGASILVLVEPANVSLSVETRLRARIGRCRVSRGGARKRAGVRRLCAVSVRCVRERKRYDTVESVCELSAMLNESTEPSRCGLSSRCPAVALYLTTKASTTRR